LLSTQILHVLPSLPAASSARQALRQIGANEKVIGITDDLGYGPIGGDCALRRAWLNETFGDGWGELADIAELEWQQVLSAPMRPVIWTCRSDAGDHAGFLEFLWRIGDRVFDVIDATGVVVRTASGIAKIPRLGCVPPAQIIDAGLLHRRERMTPDAIAAARENWARLRAENAFLRITENDRLVSKPMSYFDARLLGRVPTGWERAARVVGEAMTELARDGCFLGDYFIWSRYLSLEAEGALEIAGEGGIPDCQLRRA
jgi:hypothetical protein